MRLRYSSALAVMLLALGVVTWAWFDDGASSVMALVAASAGVPVAALLFAAGRLERRIPSAAIIGGGAIGVAVAVLSHAFVFAFAYAFLFEFANEAASLFDQLKVDPRWSTALGSPWTILLLIEVSVVAPLTEEIGKAVGAGLSHATDRRGAFLAGVAAGTGFAIVENVFYALGGGFLGEPWEAIVIGRMMGAAVHPLASGIVVMGWWEWRQHRAFGRLAARFLTGAGIHALWNGSLVVLGIVATAFDTEVDFGAFTVVSLAYTAALGVVAAALLWRVTVATADDRPRLVVLDVRDARVVGAWTVLAASFLVPMAVLLLAFPGFVGGG